MQQVYNREILIEKFYPDVLDLSDYELRFNNIYNSYVGGDGSASFRIPLAATSYFGGSVLYDTSFQENNQEITFPS